jgi:hypothetical protein
MSLARTDDCRHFSWADTIIALDDFIFATGGVVFAHVRHLVKLPTDQEIPDTMEANQLLPDAERSKHPVMEDDQFNMDA